LHDPDNITVHEPTGHGFVAEDADDIQLVQLVNTQSGWEAVPFLQFVGHDGSEVAGPAFSPDGTRLYVSSQRGRDGDGMTFEITGRSRAAELRSA
jgi:secreted PhoX family phosphatase